MLRRSAAGPVSVTHDSYLTASALSEGGTRSERIRRRSATVPGVAVLAVAITILIPVWLPIAAIVDGARLRRRFPIVRLLAFGVCWSWLEVVGVSRLFLLWLRGRTDDHDAHYDVMGWWAGAMMRAISVTTGATPQLEGADALATGDAIVLARHASLGDSMLSAWAVCTTSGLRPRYVLKRELLLDPCLDIAGLRLPNHFLHRSADDATAELDALEQLASTIDAGSVAVIFPEGTRANDRKRRRAIEKIAERDPERAARLGGLRRLLPPRAAGTTALLRGAPDADLVLAWHTGFDGLDTFGGIVDRLARPLPAVRFVARRVPRGDVASGDSFERWLDEQWLALDEAVDAALEDVP